MRTLAAAICLFFGAISIAQAGSLRVGPTRIDLTRARPVAVVRVTNNNPVRTSIDVRAQSWRQENDEDVLTDSDSLLVTPPVFDLEPGETQIVRVGLNPAIDVAGPREVAFRVFVAELPAPRNEATPAMQMLMRVGVPVFIAPTGPAAEKLQWQVAQADAGTWRIEVTNDGGKHARIARFDVTGDGKTLAREIQGAYVLPGATRVFTAPVAAAPSSYRDVALSVVDSTGNERVVSIPPAQPDGVRVAEAD
jgi:fimbrial chaperone protein